MSTGTSVLQKRLQLKTKFDCVRKIRNLKTKQIMKFVLWRYKKDLIESRTNTVLTIMNSFLQCVRCFHFFVIHKSEFAYFTKPETNNKKAEALFDSSIYSFEKAKMQMKLPWLERTKFAVIDISYITVRIFVYLWLYAPIYEELGYFQNANVLVMQKRTIRSFFFSDRYMFLCGTIRASFFLSSYFLLFYINFPPLPFLFVTRTQPPRIKQKPKSSG